ncbi:hypothetical protein Pmani_017922 [Petrolisthes manimaculis]|uniref:Uncharacterized protein n=1 Tax=Petrolisthes manimaculis TaxID=1843537 RepID=A0AAE1PL84_9EUCA|nr:hypothetical protein Pmani_017922 [Petrolisthes manimaculis]
MKKVEDEVRWKGRKEKLEGKERRKRWKGGWQDTTAGHRGITSQSDLEASQDNWMGLDGGVLSCRVVLDVVESNRAGEGTDDVTRAQSAVL